MKTEVKLDALDKKIEESTCFLNELKALEKSKKNLIKVKVPHGYAWCTPRMAETLKANQS